MAACMMPVGLVVCASRYGPMETADRLEHAVSASGMTVLARVDHAAAAMKAGLTLRPTIVLLFGNARAGTPLMLVEQTIGIDLPLRALVWEDAAGATWIGYNDPVWIAARHGAADAGSTVLQAMRDALVAVSANAAGIT